MAKIYLTDENDKVIAEVERGDNTVFGFPRVASLIIQNSKGEFLLAKRSLEKSVNPGMWGSSAAGVVEAGESYEECIARETKEEIGLDIDEFTKGPKVLKDKKDNSGKFWRQSFFIKMDVLIEELKLQDEEVAEVRWFTKNQIIKMNKENPTQYTSSIEEVLSWTE